MNLVEKVCSMCGRSWLIDESIVDSCETSLCPDCVLEYRKVTYAVHPMGEMRPIAITNNIKTAIKEGAEFGCSAFWIWRVDVQSGKPDGGMEYVMVGDRAYELLNEPVFEKGWILEDNIEWS